MAFQSCPDIAQANIILEIDGQLCENVLHFRKIGGNYTAVDIGALTAVLLGWWEDYYSLIVGVEAVYNNIKVRGLENEADFQWEAPVSTRTQGQVTGGSEPNNVAVCVTLVSGYTGRSKRGRMYTPAVPKTRMASTNSLDASYATGWTGNIYPLIGLVAAIGWEWCILSRIAGGTPRSVGIGTEIVNVALFDLVVDSQRRRLPGRGR